MVTINGTGGAESLGPGPGNEADLILGNGGNDSIFGGGGSDTLRGGDDNDSIFGGAGVDSLFGDGGNDSLDGGEGSDRLFGDAGNDVLTGGTGNTSDSLSGGDGNDVLFGDDGADSLDGGNNDDTLIGGAGADSLFGGSGFDFASYATVTGAITANLSTGIVTGEGTDTASGIEGIIGGSAADSMIGDAQANWFIGNAGADQLEGRVGSDTLDGGTGNDSLYGGLDNDSLSGGDNSDLLSGGSGDDTLVGGLGNDLLQGGVGVDTADYSASNNAVIVNMNDTLAELGGHALNDTLSGIDNIIGSAFADSLVGDNRGNVLEGGALNDTIQGNLGSDSIDGGTGDDVITGGPTTGVTPGTATVGATFDWTSSLRGEGTNLANNFADTVSGMAVEVNFSPGNNPGGNAFEVQAGPDMDPFTGGNQGIVTGGIANLDSLSGAYLERPGVGETSELSFNFSAVNPGQLSNEVNNVRFTISDIDSANNNTPPTGFQDQIVIYAYNELGDPVTINYTAGRNVSFVLRPDGGYQFTGTRSGGQQAANVAANALIISIPGPVAQVVIQYLDAGPDLGSQQFILVSDIKFDTIVPPGSDDDDTVTGSAGNDTILGGLGADSLFGGADNDSILGEVGNDTLDGGSGNDVLDGGSDNDQLSGGADRDTLIGGVGDDTLDGGTENDSLLGGAGNDSMAGGTGDDTLDGGADNDQMVGDAGNDSLFGDDGNDSIDGGADNDTISGGAGADSIVGGSGNDSINAGEGSDTVDAGAGNDTVVMDGTFSGVDTMDGGADIDTLVLDPSDNRNLTVNMVTGVVTDADTLGAQNFIRFENVTTDGGNDSVLGDTVSNVIITNGGNDSVSAGDGNDTVDGGAGNDLLYGGTGTDNLAGGTGDDTLGGGAGADTLAGGVGMDFGDYSGSGAGVGINLGSTLAGVGGDAAGDVLSGIDGLIGSNFDDTLVGFDGQGTGVGDIYTNVFYGGGGNDSLDGRGANDSLFGGADNDTIIGGQGTDTLFGGTGNDVFDYANTDFNDSVNPEIVDGGGSLVGNNIPGDFDIIDLTEYGWDRVDIAYTGAESGTITIFAANGTTVIGIIDFSEIEWVIPCFTPGTMILTDLGEVAVEAIKAGTMVVTRDNGLQPLRWIGQRHLSALELQANPDLQPVRIARGALSGTGPDRSMLVSAQHRVLIEGPRAELLFGEAEVLVPAKHLVGLADVTRAFPDDGVTYIHLLFDRHEIVQSDGIWTESFQPAERLLSAMDADVRAEVLALFPELEQSSDGFESARLSLKAHEARVLFAAE